MIAERIKHLLEIFEMMEAIIDSDLDWEQKYDLIFSEDISISISKLNLLQDYYDPDSSYKDDVLAYYNAVKDCVERYRIFLIKSY